MEVRYRHSSNEGAKFSMFECLERRAVHVGNVRRRVLSWDTGKVIGSAPTSAHYGLLSQTREEREGSKWHTFSFLSAERQRRPKMQCRMVLYLREEPYAGNPHVRICAGGGQQWPSLPRQNVEIKEIHINTSIFFVLPFFTFRKYSFYSEGC